MSFSSLFLPIRNGTVKCSMASLLTCLSFPIYFQVGMTKTDAAVQTLADINPDVVLEVSLLYYCSITCTFIDEE